MAFFPVAPGRVRRWDRRNLSAFQRAADCFRQKLRPQRSGCVVIEKYVAVIQQAGDAEVQIDARKPNRKCHTGKTQRAVGHDDRRITEVVIDDFMPIKN